MHIILMFFCGLWNKGQFLALQFFVSSFKIKFLWMVIFSVVFEIKANSWPCNFLWALSILVDGDIFWEEQSWEVLQKKWLMCGRGLRVENTVTHPHTHTHTHFDHMPSTVWLVSLCKHFWQLWFDKDPPLLASPIVFLLEWQAVILCFALSRHSLCLPLFISICVSRLYWVHPSFPWAFGTKQMYERFMQFTLVLRRVWLIW